jgi:glycosyltransferase involved in cell wall biosynthesis
MTRRLVQVCAADFTAYHLLGPLIRAARDTGWDVQFACSDGPLAAKLRDEGFRHRRVAITRSASPLRLAAAALRLAASFRADRPDIVHTHTPIGGIVGRAAAALAGGVRVVHTFHGLPLLHDEPRGWFERAFLLIERLLARRTDLFFSQARGDVARAVRFGIARAADTVVIGNGVDVTRFAPDPSIRRAERAGLGIAEDDVVVLSVSRLVREKGLLDLAEAGLRLSHIPVRFLVAGAALPSDRTDVTRQLAEHPVAAALGERWRLLGYRADVDALLRAADIFVLPSYREGLPRSVIEAMASGLPVIATRIPACAELVDDGATGLLVPTADPVALAHAIAELAADRGRRDEMGSRARARALNKHDERAIVARQLELIEKLVAG